MGALLLTNASGGTFSNAYLVVRSNGTSGQMVPALADTNANATGIEGVCIEAPLNNAVGAVIGSGYIPIKGDGSIAAGDKVFLSASTAGEVTATPPVVACMMGICVKVLASNFVLVNLTPVGLVLTDAQLFAALNPGLAAQGLLAQTLDRKAISTVASSMIGNTAYFVGVELFKGQLISNMILAIQTAGISMSLSLCSLHLPNGNRLAISADQGTAWETIGLKTVPLSPAYPVTQSGLYFGGVVAAAGTLPQMPRNGSGGTISATPLGSNAPAYATQVGAAGLPNPATFGTVAPISFWMGFS